MKQPKYCHGCGTELVYYEHTFTDTTVYDIYTGKPQREINLYRSWRCPLREQFGSHSIHDLYRVIDPEKFEWERQQTFMGWELND